MIKVKSGVTSQFEIMKKFPGEKRVQLGAELYEMARRLIEDGLRIRYPLLNDFELKRKSKEILSPWFRKKPSSQ